MNLSRPVLWRSLGVFAALVSLSACKPSAGDVCRCGSDCTDGLVCAYNGSVLAPDECRPPTELGGCVSDESLTGSDEGLDPMQPHMDMLTKLDLGGGGDSTDTGSTGAGSTDTGSTGADSSGG